MDKRETDKPEKQLWFGFACESKSSNNSVKEPEFASYDEAYKAGYEAAFRNARIELRIIDSCKE